MSPRILSFLSSIVVLKDGSIVEEGIHSELISLNGHYKKLYEMQVEENGSSSN